MIVKHNVPLRQMSWLKNVNTGGGKNVYYPETLEELKAVCLGIWSEGKDFYLFGHTSNCYFLPTFSPEYVISTVRLNKYEDRTDCVYCQCGAHIKAVARQMVQLGIEGYYGLVDLPGTIGAAVYGNAGCFGCETSDIFMEAEILTRDGKVITCNKDNMRFERRNSGLKKRLINGVILSVKLTKQKGNASEIKTKAEECHKLRLETQPGPQNNIESVFMSGKRTFSYKLLQKVIHTYLRVTKQPLSKSLPLSLWLLGYKHLIPYLYDMNRFMWLDEKAQEVFEDYIILYKKLYKGAELEINMYK